MARGDHIRIYRGGYYHHGIDLGDGSIVHFTTSLPATKAGMIIRTGWKRFVFGYDIENLPLIEGVAFNRKHVNIEEFDQVENVETVLYPADEVIHPDLVCLTALSHLKEESYHLWKNNCEHFAHYCKTGRKKSRQVEEAFERIGNWLKRGVMHPGWMLVGPPLEQARYWLLKGIYEGRNYLRQSANTIMTDEAHSSSINSVCTSLFRIMSVYIGADNFSYLQNNSGKWTVVNHEGTCASIPKPSSNLTFIGRWWLDENGLMYIESPQGWFVKNSSGDWSSLQSDASRANTIADVELPPQLRGAPLGALNAWIACPGTLQERVDAMEEVGIRGWGDAVTYFLLNKVATDNSSEFTGQYKEDWIYTQSAALWTLGMIIAAQFQKTPTEQLPYINTIAMVIKNQQECDDVRIAAIQALQVINRPHDKTVHSILQMGIHLGSERVQHFAKHILMEYESYDAK